MYRVIEYFTDLQDDDHEYRTGDIFPREGLKVSEPDWQSLHLLKICVVSR